MPQPRPKQHDLSNLTIAQVRTISDENADPAFIRELEADPRAGVRAIAERIRRRRRAERTERARMERLLESERRLHGHGFTRIAGVDEAGRGPLAGPVIAAAVILPPEVVVEGLNDSKKLTSERREALYEEITRRATTWAVGRSEPVEIDRLNILHATMAAMRRALLGLELRPERVLVDGNRVPESPYRELAIVEGDARAHCIAAASIIAKVTRDREMAEWDRQLPGYGFAGHKGYGCPEHLAAIRRLGPSRIHRLSFAPVGAGSLQAAAPGDADVRAGAGSGRLGAEGERMAESTLCRAGYAILERNYRAQGGEIDLIAEKEKAVVFVEVKTSGTAAFGLPDGRVDPGKQRRIARAARRWLQDHPLEGRAARFDVVAIDMPADGLPCIRHFVAAFTAPDGCQPA